MNGDQEKAVWQTFLRCLGLIAFLLISTVAGCGIMTSHHDHLVEQTKAKNYNLHQEWLEAISKADRRVDCLMERALKYNGESEVAHMVEYRKAATMSQLLRYRTYLQAISNEPNPDAIVIDLPRDTESLKQELEALQAKHKRK